MRKNNEIGKYGEFPLHLYYSVNSKKPVKKSCCVPGNYKQRYEKEAKQSSEFPNSI